MVNAQNTVSLGIFVAAKRHSDRLKQCPLSDPRSLSHSVMDRVSEHTTNKQKMDEFSMVYYNNLLV